MTGIILFNEKSFSALPIGARVLLLYNDGGGARLGCRVENGVIDAEGYEFCPIEQDCFSEFIRLPDTYRIFCEDRSGDPLILPQVQPCKS